MASSSSSSSGARKSKDGRSSAPPSSSSSPSTPHAAAVSAVSAKKDPHHNTNSSQYNSNSNSPPLLTNFPKHFESVDAGLRALGFNVTSTNHHTTTNTTTASTMSGGVIEEKKAVPSPTPSPPPTLPQSFGDEKRSTSPTQSQQHATIPAPATTTTTTNVTTNRLTQQQSSGGTVISSQPTIVLPPLPPQWSALAGVYGSSSSTVSSSGAASSTSPSTSSASSPSLISSSPVHHHHHHDVPPPLSHVQLLTASLQHQYQMKHLSEVNISGRDRSDTNSSHYDDINAGGLEDDSEFTHSFLSKAAPTSAVNPLSSSTAAVATGVSTGGKMEMSQQIDLNIGGHYFTTTVATLTSHRPSFFASMFSGRFPILRDSNGRVFVDRDGTHFRHILNFMRDGGPAGMAWEPSLLGLNVADLHQLLTECRFYHITAMVHRLQQHLLLLQQNRNDEIERQNRPVEQQTLFMVVYDADQLIPLTMQYLTKFGYRVVSTSVDRTIFYAVMVKEKGDPLPDDVKRELSKRLSIHSKLWVYL